MYNFVICLLQYKKYDLEVSINVTAYGFCLPIISYTTKHTQTFLKYTYFKTNLENNSLICESIKIRRPDL